MIDLVFPPAASATSVPLGVSFLKAHIDSVFGPGKIKVQDFNINYWNYIIDQNSEFVQYQSFTHGESGPFSRDYYEPLLHINQSVKKESDYFLDSVRVWLNKGILSEDLSKLFSILAENFTQSSSIVMFSCLFPDQLLFTLGFSRWLKNSRDVSIYLGGASVLVVNPSELLYRALWIDGVFTGEGEISIEAFIRDGAESQIPGLYRRRDSDVLQELPPQAISMEKLSNPDFSWADLKSYFNPEPVLPVQFSRGCKWRRCRFCAHNFSFGKYRCLSPIDAVEMLEKYLKEYGARYFYITDQYLDASFLEPFANELIKRGLPVRYTFMGRPAEDMTLEIMKLIAKSGCRWISWGVESGNARLLEIAKKGTNPDEVARVLKDSSEAGIRNQALMIFGLPGTDDLAAEDTYRFLQENREWIHNNTASEFQLYSGTPFGNNPEGFGLKVTGEVVFCRIDGKKLLSVKKEHTNISSGGDADILRGPMEAKKWKKREIWLYPDKFWNALPAEHYLLLCSRDWDLNNPDNPVIEDKIS